MRCSSLAESRYVGTEHPVNPKNLAPLGGLLGRRRRGCPRGARAHGAGAIVSAVPAGDPAAREADVTGHVAHFNKMGEGWGGLYGKREGFPAFGKIGLEH